MEMMQLAAHEQKGIKKNKKAEAGMKHIKVFRW